MRGHGEREKQTQIDDQFIISCTVLYLKSLPMKIWIFISHNLGSIQKQSTHPLIEGKKAFYRQLLDETMYNNGKTPTINHTMKLVFKYIIITQVKCCSNLYLCNNMSFYPNICRPCLMDHWFSETHNVSKFFNMTVA